MDEKWMIPYDGLSKQGSARAAEMLLCNSSARYWWSGESRTSSNGLGSISPCKGAGAGTTTCQYQRTQFGPLPRHTPHEEPHEVHACALLWQTMIYGLELLVAHHVSYIIKRLVETLRTSGRARST